MDRRFTLHNAASYTSLGIGFRVALDDVDVLHDDFFTGKFEEKKNPFFLLELSKRISDAKMIFLFVGVSPPF